MKSYIKLAILIAFMGATSMSFADCPNASTLQVTKVSAGKYTVENTGEYHLDQNYIHGTGDSMLTQALVDSPDPGNLDIRVRGITCVYHVQPDKG